MLRRTAALAALTLAASLAAVTTSAAQAADPTLVVPDSPSGDVVVTASADPATAPYLQVRLFLGGQDSGLGSIAPMPVSNAGGDIGVTVPTWGLHNDEVTFALIACASSEPSSCGTTLASAKRTVSQTLAATAVIEIPDPVLIPEEAAFVTAENEGGGRLAAYFRSRNDGTTWLPAGSRTVVSLPSLDDAGWASLMVIRCSELTDNPNFCQQVARRHVGYVGQAALGVNTNGHDVVTVNPAWSGSRPVFTISGWTSGLPYDVSWDLYDGSQRLIGPVPMVQAATNPGLPAEFLLGKNVTAPLADGTYTARFTLTTGRGDISRSAVRDIPIDVVNNPAAETASTLSAQRIVRPPHLVSVEPPERFWSARFKVRSPHPTGEGPATLVVRDAKGRIVARPRAWHEAGANVRDWIGTWSGNRQDGLMSPSGTYQAEMTMPDSYGRVITKKLGPIYLEGTTLKTRSLWVTPRSARVDAGRFVGSCSRIKAPGPLGAAGSVGLLSLDRCGNRAWTRDVVQQVFSVRIPRTGPSAEIDAYTVDGGARVDLAGMRRRGINRLADVRVGCRFPHDTPWWNTRTTIFYNQWEHALCEKSLPDGDNRGRAIQIRVRVTGGLRLEVRRFRVQLHYRVWYRVP